jgi:cytidylate kinase
MKKHFITIAGNNGGGKSSASTLVAELLGYQKKSTGDLMRQMAIDKGISLEELSRFAETDPTFDHALDEYNRTLGEQENIVLDSRLGFFFIPKAFKVFLKCDPQTAALRILEDAKINPNRHNETRQGFDTQDSIAHSITERLNSEKKRYFDLYKISDHTDPSNFDLVIDTSLPENNRERVPQIIAEAYDQWLKS